ncbi:MAG: ATP-binding cassette domain-containing protein [Armatimonadetes bacterium]|nr:ATP-binding cassette domain-containing protein [Armatimonadota bacterium]
MIAVENVSKTYGGQTALAATSLDFAEGKTTVLIGPSGCGKSTLLRIIVGLITPDAGRVALDGQEMTPASAERLRHGIGYVIQDGGLFPHLTAERNVTLLARFLGRPNGEMEGRVKELADLVQLPRESLARFPANLSGGQRQRVGLMRALMLDPKLLLLDEPLGALDPITRYELQTQLKEIFERLGKTVILVTHDMGEAAYFATGEIVLMQSGKIVQRGSLDDLLERPAQPYVSQFIRAQRSPLADVPEVPSA